MTLAASPPAGADTPRLTHREILAVFVGLMIGLLLSALDQTIVATALPTIVGDLGGLEDLSWVVTSYLLTSTVVVPLAGKVSDQFGRKRLFQIAIIVFVLGSLGSGLSRTMTQLILARAIQGVGGGAIITLALAIVGDIVSPRERGRYQGYITGVFAVASLTGPLAGGFFVDHLTWRWAFYVNVPLSIIALVVTNRNLPADVQRRTSVDYAGAALLTGGIVALLLVAVWGGQQYAWGSPQIVGLLAVTALALLGFVVQERRHPDPLISLGLFRDAVMRDATLLGFVIGVAFFAAIVYLPALLQVSMGVSATLSGLAITPMMMMLLVSSTLGGRRVTATGRYVPAARWGTVLVTAGVLALTTLEPDTPIVLPAVYVGIAGIGLGLALPVLTVAVQNAVPLSQLGMATSISHFSRTIGGTIGTAATGAILNLRVDHQLAGALPDGSLPAGVDVNTLLDGPGRVAALPEATREIVRAVVADGITFVFTLSAMLCVAALALAWHLPDRELRDTLAPTEPHPA